jgi:hypothetical protein
MTHPTYSIDFAALMLAAVLATVAILLIGSILMPELEVMPPALSSSQ